MQVSDACILQVMRLKSSARSKIHKRESRELASRTHRRSCCPVACTLDIVGDKWTLLVVRDLLLGRSHFRDFMQSPEGIATNILTDRLNRLVQHGLVERVPSELQSGKEAYQLTKQGKALGPVIRAIVKWGETHVPGAKAEMKAKR